MTGEIERRNRYDFAALLVKGVFGAVPYAGALIAEVVDSLIPNQRVDRLIGFVKILDEKIGTLGMAQEELRRRLMNPEAVDLLEDCMWQASRALTDERKEHIASLMKNSLTQEQVKHIQYKLLLAILGELSDAELIVLRASSITEPLKYANFSKQHESIFGNSGIVTISPWLELPDDTIRSSFMVRLMRMGLIGDKGITPLGCLLLIAIDQTEEYWPK